MKKGRLETLQEIIELQTLYKTGTLVKLLNINVIHALHSNSDVMVMPGREYIGRLSQGIELRAKVLITLLETGRMFVSDETIVSVTVTDYGRIILELENKKLYLLERLLPIYIPV